jgi:hypothetical protein
MTILNKSLLCSFAKDQTRDFPLAMTDDRCNAQIMEGSPMVDPQRTDDNSVEKTDAAMAHGNDREANLRTGYDQLCETYRAIDDFRAKLLGFLPVVTGGGLLLLGGEKGRLPEDLFFPVGVFGLIVTLGLFSYEIYGIEKCHALITAGKRLEVTLGLEQTGQFEKRPREVLGFVNEPFAAAIVYPAVMAAWTYLAALHMAGWISLALAAAIFTIGCGLALRYNRVLGKSAASAA